MGRRITREEVWMVFVDLVKKGRMPTGSKIERALNIPYKSSTIYKFLQNLKIKAYRAFVGMDNYEGELQNNTPPLMSDPIVIKDNFAKKIWVPDEKIKTLTTELIRSEKEIIRLKEQNQMIKNDLKTITESYQMINLKCEHLEKLTQEIQTERKMMKEIIMTDKDRQIASLQKELRETNKENLDKVKTLGFEGDEALIREKVKVIQLEDKLSVLNKKIKSLETKHQMAKERVQPLIQQIQRQKSFIQTVVTWEQMQEYEALMNKD